MKLLTAYLEANRREYVHTFMFETAANLEQLYIADVPGGQERGAKRMGCGMHMTNKPPTALQTITTSTMVLNN
jgi:hypothetical protein